MLKIYDAIIVKIDVNVLNYNFQVCRVGGGAKQKVLITSIRYNSNVLWLCNAIWPLALKCHSYFQFAQTKRGKFSSKEITKNYKKRLSGPSEEARELLSDAFENPESTPVHMINKNLQNDDKSDIIRKVIGELDSKDSTKLSNPAYQVGDDRRETRC